MDENVSLPLSEDGWEWETDAGAEYGPGGLDGECGPGGAEYEPDGEGDMSGGDPSGEGDCRDAAGARSEAVGQNIADGLGGAAGTSDRGGPDGAAGSQSRRDFGSAECGTDGGSDMSAAWDMNGGDPGAGALHAADGTVAGAAQNNTAEASGTELRSPVPGTAGNNTAAVPNTEGEYHARFGGKLPAPGQSAAGTQDAAPRFAPPVPGAMSVYGAAAVSPGALVPGAGGIPDAAVPLGAQVPFGAQMPAGAQVPLGAQAPLGAQVPFGAQAPLGAQMPVGAQVPLGAQAPFGMQTPRGAQMPVGAQMPAGAQVPLGAQTPLGVQVPLGAQAPLSAQVPLGAQAPLSAQVPLGTAAPQAALLAAQEARQRRQRDFVDFFRSRPDVQARDIPEQVYRQVQRGVPLLTAYTAWENRSLRAQLAAQRQNEMNRGRAVSAAASSGKSTASDQWARAWDSD